MEENYVRKYDSNINCICMLFVVYDWDRSMVLEKK